MERKRWARLTMIGTYSLVLADIFLAFLMLVFAPQSTFHEKHEDVFHQLMVSYGAQMPFTPLIIGLAIGSIFLLTKGSMRMEFEYRKKKATRSLQTGIAMFIWITVFIALAYNGAATDIHNNFHRVASADASLRIVN